MKSVKMIGASEIEEERMKEILRKSRSGQILPPKKGLIRFYCPICGKKLRSRYFKEEWRLNGKFTLIFQYFECPNCGYQYAKKMPS